MNIYKKFAILIFILIISIGMVSASEIQEDSTTVLNEENAESVSVVELDAGLSCESESCDAESAVIGEAETVQLRDGTPITKTLDGGSFSDIQSSIDELEDGDTLELKGTFQGNGQAINVTKSITIKSSVKATLDGKKSSSILILSANNVVVNGLNLINSKDEIYSAICADYQGSDNSKYSILNCNFENNADSSCIGSGINSLLEVSACTFKNNKAHIGAAISSYSKNTIVKKCTFIGNSADIGGAVYSSATGLSIVGCIFKNNDASNGGCIYSECAFSIKDSTFDNNKAAIYTEASCSIANSKFINNKALGGSVINSKAPLTISKSHFENNAATVIDSSSKVTITDSKFVNNKRGIVLSNGKTTVKNCYFTKNRNYIISGPSYVANSKFYQNNGDLIFGKTYVINSVFKSNKDGHCIWSEGKSTIKKCSFTSNTAYDSSAIYGSAVISHCNFTKNRVTGKESSGGAIMGRGLLKINNCRFIKNSAKVAGGAISNDKKTIITKCTFLNNRALDGGAINSIKLVAKNCVFKNSKGGAITATKLTAFKCTFTKNRDSLHAGAIHVLSGSIKNCVFTRNYAKKAGGAIYVTKKCTITNSKFTRNSVKYYGSAIALFLKSVVKVKKCRFSKNSLGKGKNPFAWPFRTYGKGVVVCIGNQPKFTAVRCKGLSMAVKKYPL